MWGEGGGRRAHLHALVCVDSVALQQVDAQRLVDGPQQRGVLLLPQTHIRHFSYM